MNDMAKGALTGVGVFAAAFVALAVLIPPQVPGDPAMAAEQAQTADGAMPAEAAAPAAGAVQAPAAPPAEAVEAPAAPPAEAAQPVSPAPEPPPAVGGDAVAPGAPVPDETAQPGAEGTAPPPDQTSAAAAPAEPEPPRDTAPAVGAAADALDAPVSDDPQATDLPPAGRTTPGSTVRGVTMDRLPQIASSGAETVPVAPAPPAPAPLVSATDEGRAAPPATSATPVPPPLVVTSPTLAAPVTPAPALPTPALTSPTVATPGLDTPTLAPPPQAPALVAQPAAPAAPPAAAPPPEPDSARLAARPPVEGVRVGRLPQVGGAETGTAAPEGADTRPAWQRNSAAFDAAGRPALGLVLLDPGNDPLAEAALLDLPLTVTVALDPFDADAPRRAQAYRERGHEVVLALDGIAPRATAGDLDVLFTAWAQAFPQALGVFEAPPGDGRRARALAPVLVPTLSDLGLALIAPDRGLSPLLTAGRGAGLPVAGLYRQVDAEDEAPDAIRRHLDRAGFEAERLGTVAILGRADRPETLAAITAWLASPRAARVAPAPVGAVVAGP